MLHTSQRGVGFVSSSRRAHDLKAEGPFINGETSSDLQQARHNGKPSLQNKGEVQVQGSYSIRRDTRKLEARIESHLAELERWIVNGQHMLGTQARSGSDEQWDGLLSTGDALSDELECLLDQLADMNSIQAVLATNADANGFYEQEEVRQRESRQKFLQQSFTRLRHSAVELKQKATLCKKAAMLKGGTSRNEERPSGLEMLATEQRSIKQASAALDGLVQQSIETQLVLREQTVYLQDQTGKVDQLAGALPQANRIMSFIKVRKWRDMIILGVFISICLCALLLYVLSYRK